VYKKEGGTENTDIFWRSVAAILKQIWCCPCVYKKEEQRERGGRNSYNRKIGVEEGFDLGECSLGI
jgi:hypothetical protein